MSDMSTQKVARFSLGERIRKAREDMDWLQADLADGVKKSRETISNWESNKHKPSKLELDFIAELTGYPLEFFTESDDESGKYLITDRILVAA